MLDVPIWPPIFLNPDENDADDTQAAVVSECGWTWK